MFTIKNLDVYPQYKVKYSLGSYVKKCENWNTASFLVKYILVENDSREFDVNLSIDHDMYQRHRFLYFTEECYHLEDRIECIVMQFEEILHKGVFGNPYLNQESAEANEKQYGFGGLRRNDIQRISCVERSPKVRLLASIKEIEKLEEKTLKLERRELLTLSKTKSNEIALKSFNNLIDIKNQIKNLRQHLINLQIALGQIKD